MCIIAVQMKDTANITSEEFKECGKGNKDGFGLMYAKDGKLQIQKTKDYDEAWDIYQSALSANSFPIVLHWRTGTGGGTGINMVHPFTDESMSWALVHNGIMRKTKEDRTVESDTAWFAKNVISPIVKDFGLMALHENGIGEMIYNTIGSNDKLVFMDTNGILLFFHKALFVSEREGDLLFSNGGYKKTTTVYSGSSTLPAYERKCGVCGKKVDNPYGEGCIQISKYIGSRYCNHHFHEGCVKNIDKFLKAIEEKETHSVTPNTNTYTVFGKLVYNGATAINTHKLCNVKFDGKDIGLLVDSTVVSVTTRKSNSGRLICKLVYADARVLWAEYSTVTGSCVRTFGSKKDAHRCVC